jgi:hypothetical protein
VTQALIQFIGSLSSWWTRIVIGALTLIFIGVQTVLANRKSGPKGAQMAEGVAAKRRQQRRLAFGLGGLVLVAIVAGVFVSRSGPSASAETAVAAACTVQFRETEAADLVRAGAVIVYNRAAGPLCVDELYAIYPDGRITGTDGQTQVEKQISPAEVEQLLVAISVDHGWFTNDIFSTYLNPCRQCFAHYIDISYQGQQKAVTGVDGTTARPPGFAFALAEIRPLLPEIPVAP